jgi:hypothetical protein
MISYKLLTKEQYQQIKNIKNGYVNDKDLQIKKQKLINLIPIEDEESFFDDKI